MGYVGKQVASDEKRMLADYVDSYFVSRTVYIPKKYDYVASIHDIHIKGISSVNMCYIQQLTNKHIRSLPEF